MTTPTTYTPKKVHAVLRAAGFRKGTSKYDASGYSLVPFVDYIGVQEAFDRSMGEYHAALTAAGIPTEVSNMLLVPRSVKA